MNTLIKSIENIINENINGLIDKISSNYDIPKKDLLKLWENNGIKEKEKKNKKDSDESESENNKEDVKEDAKETKKKSKTVSSSSSSDGCPYKYIKGAKSGTICGVKSKNGNKYCSLHKKYEDSSPRESRKSPILNKKEVKERTSSKSSTKSSKKTDSGNIILRVNPINKTLYHPETEMIFDSEDKKTVIAKSVENKILELNEKDIEICKSWGFPYKLNKKKDLSDEDEELDSDVEEDRKNISEKIEKNIIKKTFGVKDEKKYNSVSDIENSDEDLDEE